MAALLGPDVAAETPTGAGINTIPVGKISPNPFQPRRSFPAESLEELAGSVKEQGLLQPIVVRPRKNTVDEYEIVAGERRWRAATMAKLQEVPAIIKQVSDQDAAVMALVENIQREDLNPYEQALAVEELRKQHNYTQADLAQVLNRSRAFVTNLLRLLKLEDKVKDYILSGKIEMGHAKVLLALESDEQVRAAEEAVDGQMSVREVEKMVQRILKRKTKKSNKSTDPNITALQEELSNKLGVKVLFNHKRGGTGKMIIHYHSTDELDGVLKSLKLKK